MRLSILSSVWTAYLASRLPCHPTYLTWSREHVIPKSVIPSLANDPRNIIPMPMVTNNARGNRPYTDDWENGSLVYACSNCPHPGFCAGAAVMTPSGLHPPNAFKGPIARSVLYSVGEHPKLSELINDRVLNIDTAIKWDSHFPMTKEEKDWLDSL